MSAAPDVLERVRQNDEQLLHHLLVQASRSLCAKLKFGAAALNGFGEVVAWGHNHDPREAIGLATPCGTSCAGGIRKGVASGKRLELCYAVHAEQDAVVRAWGPVQEVAVAGLLPDGSLFDNGGGFYCTVCARIMMAAGVRVVSIWTGGQRKRLSIEEAWSQSYRIATGVP